MHPAFSKKVRDIMSRGVVTVPFDAPLREVIRKMADEDVTAVVAVDNRNEVMGVISSIDVISYLKDRSPAEIDSSVAEDVMTPSTIHIEPTKTLKDAADIMVKKRIHRLVVLHPHKVAGNVPVGILSATDLIKALNEAK